MFQNLLLKKKLVVKNWDFLCHHILGDFDDKIEGFDDKNDDAKNPKKGDFDDK